MSDNRIYDNTSDLGGGGIRFCYFYGTLPRPAFERNEITGNSSQEGGGVLCYEADSLEARQCVIAWNESQTGGGGLLADAVSMVPSLFLNRCTLHGNRAAPGGIDPVGGGVLARKGDLTVRSTIVSSNEGGGLVAAHAEPAPVIDSDYCDVWNNGLYDYYGCAPGAHSISSDPLYCQEIAAAPPWYCLFEHSPCNGTGMHGEDIGAGWVACFAGRDVVFYDNFSDQADDGWVVEEERPEQVEVEDGEYSMNSLSTSARAYVADFVSEDFEFSVWFRPVDTQMGGETHARWRMRPEDEAWYELVLKTEEQRGMLLRYEFGLICIMAEFDCPQYADAWHKLTIVSSGALLDGTLEIPFGMIVPLFHLIDPVPLPAGTIGLGVAWASAPGVRGAQHTHFDRVMVCAPDPADLASEPWSGGIAGEPLVLATPNPSAGAVSFRLRAPAEAWMELFDAQGRLVRTLRWSGQGTGEGALLRLDWDGRDESGRLVGSGVYAWRLRTGAAAAGAAAQGRLVLMR